jgi:hypothetical protein
MTIKLLYDINDFITCQNDVSVGLDDNEMIVIGYSPSVNIADLRYSLGKVFDLTDVKFVEKTQSIVVVQPKFVTR